VYVQLSAQLLLYFLYNLTDTQGVQVVVYLGVLLYVCSLINTYMDIIVLHKLSRL
jgi:hypothetical protein